MYKKRDIINKKVIDEKGKELGVVQDLIIDLDNKTVKGFKIKKNSFLKKEFYILQDNIIYFGNRIIINGGTKGNFFYFKDIKGMEVYDLRGIIIGMVEDLFISYKDFSIKSLILTEGFFKNYTKGKRIVLLEDLIVGEESAIYIKEKNYYFYSKIHGVEENDNGK